MHLLPRKLLLPVPDTYKLFFYTAQLLWYLQSGYFHLRSLFAFMLVSERAQEPQPSMSALAVRPHLHSYLDSTSRLCGVCGSWRIFNAEQTIRSAVTVQTTQQVCDAVVSASDIVVIFY